MDGMPGGEVAEQIDAVITWVDGSDQQHARKRARFESAREDPTANDLTRFADRGELGWCLASIIRFAPFVRHIYVVTDEQMPPHIARVVERYPQWRDRLTVVDHTQIFAGYRDVLPTFNSLTIETALHRIPGLSDRFLYLNDDFCFASQVAAGEFFDRTGPVLQGVVRPLPNRLRVGLKWGSRRVRGKPRTASNRISQGIAARLAGRRSDHLHCGHHPHALRRSTLEAYFERQPHVFREQIAHRFRSPDQFVPVALANNLEFSAGRPHDEPARVGYLRPPTSRVRRRERGSNGPAGLDDVISDLLAGRLRTLCIQSVDQLDRETLQYLTTTLDRYFGLEPSVADEAEASSNGV